MDNMHINFIYSIIFWAIIVTAFLFCKISKPKYINYFPETKKLFSEETLRRIKKLRLINNPYDEEVGDETDRCKICGLKNKKQKNIRFPSLHEQNVCPCCNLAQ